MFAQNGLRRLPTLQLVQVSTVLPGAVGTAGFLQRGQVMRLGPP